MESHSSFCSSFSPAEFPAAVSNLSSSTATGPDRVAYSMLKHLLRSGMDFLLYIFNLSWFSHFFPSIWKTSSIISIHKMGKPLDSPASIWLISLTSCVSKLFECIILSRLLFFLQSNSILSSRQAGFRPGRSTLDQILYLSQSISDGFNKPRPDSRTILSTIDFSKAFDSVWHRALFHKLISAGLCPCFARWTQSFLSDRRACVVYQNHKSRSFRVRRGVPQGSVLGPVLFSLFINDLPASLPSSVSCCFYADDLAIWSSPFLVTTAVEATQGALFRLERWSEYWCLPLNPSKYEASFFLVDPHQANLQPNLLLLGSRLRFNPTPTFLGVTFDRTRSFTKHVSLLKAKFFPRLKALRCISASSWGPSKESLTFLYKSFLRSLLTYASPGWFPFLSATNFTKLERLHRAASRAITGCLSSSLIPLLSETSLPSLRVSLTHFTLFSYERALRLPTSFPISGLVRLGVKPRLCRSSWRAFASTHQLMLPSTCSREALVACPPCPPWNLPSFTVESTLSSLCCHSDLPHSRQCAAFAHLDSLPLMIWYSEQMALFLFLLARAAPAFLPTALSVALRPLYPFRKAQYAQVFPLKPAPFCTLFAGLGSTNKSAISLLSCSYLTLVLSSPPYPLLHLSCYLKLCGRSGRNCPLSPSVPFDYNGSPDTRFSRGTTRLMSWPDGERYSCSPQSLVVSLLLFLVSTLVFSQTGGVLSHLNSSTHRFPRFHRGTCAPSSCSLCAVSSSLQRTQPSFRLLSLWDWQNRESFMQRLWTLVPGHLSSHSILSSNGLFAPLSLWRLSVSLRP